MGAAVSAAPGRIISFSETEFVIESAIDAPVAAPVRVSWDTYVALGEVLERRADGALKVTKVLLQHYVDLAVAAESFTYWS
jgi:hypothetical protein